MNVKDHPELEVLNKYLINSTSAEFSDLRLHLAQCSECRAQVDGLNALAHISHLPTDTLTETQHQKIHDYINDELPVGERKEIEQFIHSNTSAMKAALHITSHNSLQDRISSATVTGFQESTTNRFLSTFSAYLKSLLSYQTPLWISAPVTAALVALLSLNLFEQNATQQPYTIASYQDNAIIQFRSKDNLPGIGFFAKSELSSTDYDGLQVNVSDNRHFELHWPAISNAVKYKLRLHRFNQGKKSLVSELTTDRTSVVIETESEKIFSRYEWSLTGNTSDNRSFMAKGGFVINPSIQGKKR